MTPSADVLVLLPTYEPEPDRLVRQLDSLRAQTHRSWSCLVRDDGSSAQGREVVRRALGDDPRFTLDLAPVNTGFYRNVEALLSAAGAAPWVALCDQDDVWFPDKLARLLALAERSPRAALVHSDVQVWGAQDEVLSPTYWVGRDPGTAELADLLFANTVTGAASLVRGDVARLALPFPAQRPSSFHDHWLALVARVVGEIRYEPTALQAYVQHGGNAIGHQPGRSGAGAAAARLLARPFWRRPVPRYYDDEVLRLSELAAALLARTTPSAEHARVLRRTASLHGPRPALPWLVGQALREVASPGVTMHRRRRVLASVLWTQVERRRPAQPSSRP